MIFIAPPPIIIIGHGKTYHLINTTYVLFLSYTSITNPMNTPFSAEQFFEVFNAYNSTVFPLQALFYALAFFTVYVSVKKTQGSGKIISLILSYFWFWMGAVYHIIFFSVINKAAYLFGAVFIMQSVLIFYFGVYKDKLSFQFAADIRGIGGLIFIVYSLLLYLFIGYITGHVYPLSPTFGLPCPTTIFTLGLLLWNRNAELWPLIGIPLVWSVIGSTAVLKFGIAEDMGLLAAGIISFIIMVLTAKKDKNHVTV